MSVRRKSIFGENNCELVMLVINANSAIHLVNNYCSTIFYCNAL